MHSSHMVRPPHPHVPPAPSHLQSSSRVSHCHGNSKHANVPEERQYHLSPTPCVLLTTPIRACKLTWTTQTVTLER